MVLTRNWRDVEECPTCDHVSLSKYAATQLSMLPLNTTNFYWSITTLSNSRNFNRKNSQIAVNWYFVNCLLEIEHYYRIPGFTAGYNRLMPKLSNYSHKKTWFHESITVFPCEREGLCSKKLLRRALTTRQAQTGEVGDNCKVAINQVEALMKVIATLLKILCTR